VFIICYNVKCRLVSRLALFIPILVVRHVIPELLTFAAGGNPFCLFSLCQARTHHP